MKYKCVELSFDNNGYAICQSAKDGKFGLVARDGNSVVDFKFDSIEPYMNGHIVQMGSLCGYLGKGKTNIVPFAKTGELSEEEKYEQADLIINHNNEIRSSSTKTKTNYKALIVCTERIMTQTANKAFLFAQYVLDELGMDFTFDTVDMIDKIDDNIDIIIGYDTAPGSIEPSNVPTYSGNRYSKYEQCTNNKFPLSVGKYIPSVSLLLDHKNSSVCLDMANKLKELSDEYMTDKFMLKGMYGARCIQNAVVRGIDLFPTSERDVRMYSRIQSITHGDCANVVAQPLLKFNKEYRVILGLVDTIIYDRRIKSNGIVSIDNDASKRISIDELPSTHKRDILQTIKDIQDKMINDKTHLWLSIDLGLTADGFVHVIEYQMEVPSNNPATRGIFWLLVANSISFALGQEDCIKLLSEDNENKIERVSKVLKTNNWKPFVCNTEDVEGEYSGTRLGRRINED